MEIKTVPRQETKLQFPTRDPKEIRRTGWTAPAPTQQRNVWTASALVLLSLLAPALGGSTALWAEALVAIATGLFLLFVPPKASVGWPANALFLGFLLLSLAAYLPANWFAPDPVRQTFAGLGTRLPATHTPQPWITLESVLLQGLGLAWCYTLFCYGWGRQRRVNAWQAYGIGIAVLAAILIVGNVAKMRVPFWPVVPEFGFFLNRNQTANVLGLGGIMIYALGLQTFQENRHHWWIWIVSLSLIYWALILNYSRAGILLLIFGALTVQIYWWITSTDNRRTLVSLGGLFFLVAVLILNGGSTLTRFRNETAEFFSTTRNFRFQIYSDALNLLTHSSILGIGLGNFHPIFSVHRHYSLAPNETIHPESDWLWSAVELGWLGPLLLFLFFLWWIKRCSPFESGTFRLMRFAAFVCGCAFAVHGMFDVSGHRIGALWPALFLASTALHPSRNLPPSPLIARIFRGLGLLLIGIGTVWLISVIGRTALPTTATLRDLVSKANTAAEQNDFSRVVDPASEGLRIAPLNWMLYQDRAAAVAALYYSNADAIRDFKIARYLLPQWPKLYLQEGEVWIAAGEEDLAFDVWSDALRRFPEEAPRLYGEMLDYIKHDAELVARWRELGRGNPKCLLVSLQHADPAETRLELDRLFFENPDLHSFTPAEQKIIFDQWYEHGDKLVLAETLQKHPEWQRIAWRLLARVYADYRDYRPAYETAVRFAPPPQLPEIGSGESIDSLIIEFKVSGGAELDGLKLARAEANSGQIDDALAILKTVSAKPKASSHVYYLEAELWARKGEWQKAWQAISQYDRDLK